MKLAVIGTGYVGLVQAVCLADLGNEVIGVDIDQKKIDSLNTGKSPIYEPGIEEILARNLREKRLHFTSNIKTAVDDAEIIFIAVGTPSDEHGRADLRFVEDAARAIGQALIRPVIIVNKSTVPIGTGDLVGRIIREQTSIHFTVVSNPEFLREGSAIADFMHPDRVVVGIENDNDRVRRIMKKLYVPLKSTILMTDVKTAELIKYASNSMLATQISFINSIAQLAESVGADVTKVAEGMRLDARIGKRAFLDAGVGYGGSCFPKDVQALIAMAHDAGVHASILEAVEDINRSQRQLIVRKIRARVKKLNGAVIAVWGLAFKPKTDDMRDAPAVAIIEELQRVGAVIRAYDPVAKHQAEQILKNLTFGRTALETAQKADLLVILTEWDEFRQLDLAKLRATLARPYIVDGRNMYDPSEMAEQGFVYDSIGRPQIELANTEGAKNES
ncbi:UDP-glucose/GDP-mannose dehydrogenase family protein [Candidatus Berkelbacteria bacterium]|nr:UDP-glucose/GDP-mannose dehydrogenase family protein [Candidatus Berkelbacteria bacterium]